MEPSNGFMLNQKALNGLVYFLSRNTERMLWAIAAVVQRVLFGDDDGPKDSISNWYVDPVDPYWLHPHESGSNTYGVSHRRLACTLFTTLFSFFFSVLIISAPKGSGRLCWRVCRVIFYWTRMDVSKSVCEIGQACQKCYGRVFFRRWMLSNLTCTSAHIQFYWLIRNEQVSYVHLPSIAFLRKIGVFSHRRAEVLFGMSS